MELDAGTKLDAPRRVVYALPRFGEIWPNAELLVAVGEKFIDEAVDVVREPLILRMRVGGLHVAPVGPTQRFRVGGTDNNGDRDQHAGNAGDRQNAHGDFLRDIDVTQMIITEKTSVGSDSNFR